jgi:GDP-mannose 6-dehydrogenase
LNIGVFGLGYVGCVTAACFAKAGHRVWGVDINPDKVALINDGQSPIVEPGLEGRIRLARDSGQLIATLEPEAALANTDITFIAVATPSRSSGEIDATHLVRACEQIASALDRLGRSQTVVIRSSLLPSVFRQCKSVFENGCGERASVCVNPEFLREGTAIKDFDTPPYTVLGTDDVRAEDALRTLYSGVTAPVFTMKPEEAVMVKYASNAYHALKVVFGNEIGQLCKAQGIDGRRVMEVFSADISLNISSRYLMPGFAFGGSCLPKDVRAMVYSGRQAEVDLPLVSSIIPSNRRLLETTGTKILSYGERKLGLIGLSFKSHTDDLRESPFVDLAEYLLGKGMDLRIFDSNVSLARIHGANRTYIEKTIPHISRLLVPDLRALADHAEVIIVGHAFPGVEALPQILNDRVRVIDLCNMPALRILSERYEGIAW